MGFITKYYFTVEKDIRLIPTHCLILKIPCKQELQHIAFNYSLDNNLKDFLNFYKKCTAKLHSILVIDTTKKQLILYFKRLSE